MREICGRYAGDMREGGGARRVQAGPQQAERARLVGEHLQRAPGVEARLRDIDEIWARYRGDIGEIRGSIVPGVDACLGKG